MCSVSHSEHSPSTQTSKSFLCCPDVICILFSVSFKAISLSPSLFLSLSLSRDPPPDGQNVKKQKEKDEEEAEEASRAAREEDPGD